MEVLANPPTISSSAAPILTLPPEILLQIIYCIDDLKSITNLTATNRCFRNLGNDEIVIKQICKTAWDLLLQPETLREHPKASKLMELLLHLLPKIEDAKSYTANLFPNGLHTELFKQLANIHLERCLKLILQYFGFEETQNFIKTGLASGLTLIDPGDTQADIKNRGNKVFLYYVINHFKPIHDIDAVEFIIQNFIETDTLNVNVRDRETYNALDYAIEQLDLLDVQALLAHPQTIVDLEENENALDYAINQAEGVDGIDQAEGMDEELSIVKAFLKSDKINHFSVFYDAILAKNEGKISIFWQILDEQEKQALIAQALAWAEEDEEPEEVKQRIRELT